MESTLKKTCALLVGCAVTFVLTKKALLRMERAVSTSRSTKTHFRLFNLEHSLYCTIENKGWCNCSNLFALYLKDEDAHRYCITSLDDKLADDLAEAVFSLRRLPQVVCFLIGDYLYGDVRFCYAAWGHFCRCKIGSLVTNRSVRL